MTIGAITTSIQLAIAPIFLLVGTGSLLNVVTSRLGRIIDRARVLENAIEAGEEASLENRHLEELKTLDQRMRHGNRAVLFCSLSAVLICALVAILFMLEMSHLNASVFVSIIFIAVVLSLMIGMISFLLEVSIATRVLQVRTELLTRNLKS